MPLFYKYIYDFNDGEYIIYAVSRTEADAEYLNIFKVKTVKFLRREPW